MRLARITQDESSAEVFEVYWQMMRFGLHHSRLNGLHPAVHGGVIILRTCRYVDDLGFDIFSDVDHLFTVVTAVRETVECAVQGDV